MGGFDACYAWDAAEILGNLLGVTFEADRVPEVKTRFARAFGTAVVFEYALYFRYFVTFAEFVERNVACQNSAAAGTSDVDRVGRFPVEFHADLPIHNSGFRISFVRRRRCRIEIFLTSGGEYQGEDR